MPTATSTAWLQTTPSTAPRSSPHLLAAGVEDQVGERLLQPTPGKGGQALVEPLVDGRDRRGREGMAARVVGVQRQTVNIWLQRYRAKGEEGMLDGRRVSPRRGKGHLTPDEARQVQGWIVERTPDQLERRLAKRLGLSTAQLYLQRWGFTPQRPLARAKERQPAAIAAWLATTYPAIVRRARATRAVIYWGDETGLSNQDRIGRSYAPSGSPRA
jgi:transposase